MRNWILAGVARAIAVLLLLVGHAGVVRADPILVSDERYVLTYVTTEPPGTPIMDTRGPELPFGPFDVSISSSLTAGGSTARSTTSQQSVVSPTRFTGTGSQESVAEANGVWVGAAAGSAFAITFDLLVPHVYHFTGDFRRSGTGFVEFETAFAGEGELGEGRELGTSGVLAPGRHQFYISVLTEAYPGENGIEHAMGSYDVDLSLEPVPEPGSLALLATGLAGAIARRRLRRE